MDRKEGYEAAQSEASGDWYIIHGQWKGTVFHTGILADSFDTEDETRARIAELQSAE